MRIKTMITLLVFICSLDELPFNAFSTLRGPDYLPARPA
jgi:hypothetical protein